MRIEVNATSEQTLPCRVLWISIVEISEWCSQRAGRCLTSLVASEKAGG
jgi:hypothetical protein